MYFIWYMSKWDLAMSYKLQNLLASKFSMGARFFTLTFENNRLSLLQLIKKPSNLSEKFNVKINIKKQNIFVQKQNM